MPDFLSLIRAIEQLAYELMVWLLFLPLTIAKVVLRPDMMIRFVIAEADKPEEDAYSSAMRPVAFLMVSLLLGLILVPLTEEELRAIRESSQFGSVLADSPVSLLGFRTLAFGYFPMSGAIVMDIATPGRVDRNSLKVPFSLHCYIFAPFALVCSPSLVMLSRGETAYLGIIVTAHVWLFAALFLLYRINGFRIATSILSSLLVYVMGLSLNLLVLSIL